MSELTDQIGNVFRKRGRPRKNPIVQQSEASPEAATPIETESVKVSGPTDAEILEHDLGDIAARGSWNPNSGKPFAARESYAVTMSYLPDLNPPRTLGYRHDPTKQFNRAWLEEDGSRSTRDTGLYMKRKGWTPALASDFVICEELGDFIQADDNDRLVYADLNGKAAAVIMVRDYASYRTDRKELLKHSDSMQLTAEQKAAALQESLRSRGMTGVVASSALTDDNGA